MEFVKNRLSKRKGSNRHVTTVGWEHLVTLHCEKCNAILSDSTQVCGEVETLDSVICSGVTHHVVVDDTKVSADKGALTNCIYSLLTCRKCGTMVGKIIHTSAAALADVRSLFLLCKSAVSCYILDSCSLVKASTLTFEVKKASQRIAEVKQQFETQLERMSLLNSRLTDRSVRRTRK